MCWFVSLLDDLCFPACINKGLILNVRGFKSRTSQPHSKRHKIHWWSRRINFYSGRGFPNLSLWKVEVSTLPITSANQGDSCFGQHALVCWTIASPRLVGRGTPSPSALACQSKSCPHRQHELREEEKEKEDWKDPTFTPATGPPTATHYRRCSKAAI